MLIIIICYKNMYNTRLERSGLSDYRTQYQYLCVKFKGIYVYLPNFFCRFVDRVAKLQEKPLQIYLGQIPADFLVHYKCSL